jgi:hypothetical protein
MYYLIIMKSTTSGTRRKIVSAGAESSADFWPKPKLLFSAEISRNRIYVIQRSESYFDIVVQTTISLELLLLGQRDNSVARLPV